MNRASADAKTLQDLLAAMVRDTMHRTEHMSTSYETALQSFTARANDDADTIRTTLAAAVSSSVLLQNELVSCSCPLIPMSLTRAAGKLPGSRRRGDSQTTQG